MGKKGWNGNGEKSCVYCGTTTPPFTAEHPFPKNLFPKPQPTNLITVPACRSCNDSYKLDDEYFRVFAVTPAFDKDFGRRMWDEKIVGSSFKRSPLLKSEIAETLRPFRVSSPGGVYLGHAMAVELDLDRVNRILEKIVRGLFRHHFARRLATATSFFIRANVKPRRVADAGLLQYLGPVQSIGDGRIAQYRFAFVPQVAELSIWAIHLYQTTVSVVFVNTDPWGKN